MAGRVEKTVFHVVSPNRDLAIRQLRSYVASLGATVTIYRQADQLLEAPTLSGVVIVDDHDAIDPSYLDRLVSLPYNIFVHDRAKAALISDDKEARISQFSIQARCNINEFFESQMIRTHLTQTLFESTPRSLHTHLPWGYAERRFDCREVPYGDIEGSLTRRYGLERPCRNKLGAFLGVLNDMTNETFTPEDLVFFCDGIQVLLVCRTRVSPDQQSMTLSAHLEALCLGQVIVNKLNPVSWEVALALPLTTEFESLLALRSTVIFNQVARRAGQDLDKVVRLDLVRAG